MVRGLIGSLIAAAVFFTAGGISVAILGTNSRVFSDFKEFDADFEELLLDSDKDGKWSFECCPEIALSLSGTKAHITPVEGNEVTLSVKTDGVSVGTGKLSVKAAVDKDRRCLGIAIGHNGFFIMDISTITAEIGLPNAIYNRLQLSMGSGSVTAENVKALANELTVGSGKLMFSQSTGFTADSFSLDMGSGSAEVKNSAAKELGLNIGSGSVIMSTSATEHFGINMGSGKFEVSGLGGTGSIDVASGKGIATFADTDSIDGSEFDLSSGSLTVHFPKNVNTEIHADVSSGSIVVDCAGVNKKIRDNETVILNEGGAEIYAYVSSGKMSILNTDKTTVAQVTIVDNEYAVQFADTITAEAAGATAFIFEEHKHNQ